MGKNKKKRNKKYQPPDAQPVIHRFSAEEEVSKSRGKRIKLWAFVAGGVAIVLLLLAWLIF